MAELNLGTLYDLNKQAMSTQEPLGLFEFNLDTDTMMSDVASRNYKYWMLLSNERKDYTVFIVKTREGTLKELRECLQNRGQVLSIDKQEDGNYEIWIRDYDTQENFVYYFFDYRFGIIEA